MLYAVRLLMQNELVREAFNSPGSEYFRWIFVISYLINLPFAYFARELLGQGWKRTISIWSWFIVAFAIVAIPTLFVFGNLYWMVVTNGVLVVGGTLLILLHLLIGRRTATPLAASLLWPLLIFGMFIVLENEGFRPGGHSIEPIGFLVLLAAFAWIAVSRALATERTLEDVQQELETARRIQNSIIPQTAPSLNGIRLSSRYQPMTAVAGDFYDFLAPSDHL